MDNPPWFYIVHDLNPRAMSRRVRGFTLAQSAQSWFQNLLAVAVASALITMAGLAQPRMLVEVQGIAVLGDR